MLKAAVAQTKAEFDRLNARSFEYKALKQEAESDRGLYQELVRRIKEAGINSSFQNSSIRISDPARPGLLPVSPNIRLNLLLAGLFSSLFAIGVAFDHGCSRQHHPRSGRDPADAGRPRSSGPCPMSSNGDGV